MDVEAKLAYFTREQFGGSPGDELNVDQLSLLPKYRILQ